MPFFELDEGRLVPARLGHVPAEDLDAGLLQTLREQVLDVLRRPLFPVTWDGDDRRPGSYRPAGAPVPRLTAMDASGQVVTVEVVERLGAVELVDALSRAGRNSDLGWTEVAGSYPRGQGAFRRDWNAFRESMPPRPAPGPRLVVVAGSVEEAVRPALQVLGDSGVVVHEVAVRETADRRRLLEVAEVRPDLLPPAGPVLSAGTPRPGVSARTTTLTSAAPGGAPASASTTMAEIARSLGAETPLVWEQLRRGLRHEAVLTVDGKIRLPDGRGYDDPEAAAAVVSGRADADGWRVWRFGPGGPSLDDARTELAAAPGGTRGGRGRRRA